jgi:glutamate-ammonia-ligase adenylyltransferase
MQKSLHEALKSLTASIVKETERIDTVARLTELGYPASTASADIFEKLAKKFCPEPSSIEHFPVIIADFFNAPHPQGALLNLLKYAEITANPGVLLVTLAQAGPLREVLATTFGSSQYMADIIIRNPGYLYWLIEQRTWDMEDSADTFEAELAQEVSFFHTRDGKLNAIRRYHRKALLRIGVQDLLAQRSVDVTTERLSDLADAIIRTLLSILSKGSQKDMGESPPEASGEFAVIALGKLGGRELNYSSDIDLIYLCSDTSDAATSRFHALAQSLTEALSEITAEGYLYRVDLRLRPDGKSGPLVNTITSMQIYYENRGKPWEFQAMLKARVVAGDTALGNTFIENISKLIFNPSLSYSPVEDIGQMRKRIQENIPVHERPFNIKLMEGGIRDIEFIIQTIQLLYTSQHPDIHATGTLAALNRIQNHALLEKAECDSLRNAYRFLRLVEHRLQMMHQIKTHTVPESREDVALLATRVSKGPLGEFSYDEFIITLTTHLKNVRIMSERFFSEDDAKKDSLLFLLPEKSQEARAALEKFGITDVDSAINLIHMMAYGSFPHLFDRNTRISFANLLPRLLKAVSMTGDPGLTLANVSRIAAAGRNEYAFYRLFHESEGARALIIAIAGISSRLTGGLCNRIEIMDALLVEPYDVIDRSLSCTPEWGMLKSSKSGLRSGNETSAQALEKQLKQLLDHLHLAAFFSDIREETFPSTLAESRAQLAKHWITEASENLLGKDAESALFTLGSFAVSEPRFTSDIDLLLVTRANDTEQITKKLHVLNSVISESGIFKLDFRLRGEGANAPLVQTVDFYENYFRTRMSLWERIAFSKYVCWWGCDEIAANLHQTLTKILAKPFSKTEIESLVQMRKKLETLAGHRIEDWETKRSAGGRYDIEYLCAIGLAQTTRREDYPFTATTEERLRMLEAAGILDAEETKTLLEALVLFTRIEYLLELQGFSLPQTTDRDMYLEKYIGRTYAYLGFLSESDVKIQLITTKANTRRIFTRFIGELA